MFRGRRLPEVFYRIISINMEEETYERIVNEDHRHHETSYLIYSAQNVRKSIF